MIRKTKLFMDTAIEVKVVPGPNAVNIERKIERAFDAFRKVEEACSRFHPNSELMLACAQINQSISVSPFLFEPLRFAWELASLTNGVFDPTVGGLMEKYGFNMHYLTRNRIERPYDLDVTYRDVTLNDADRTLCLNKPMIIDLGAVAKGFAIDIAVNELKEMEGFIINAGGDLYAGGKDEQGAPWKIGIQHPVEKDQMIAVLSVTDEAVCTSGSYERPSETSADVHHLIHPITRQSPNEWFSCTVIAPYAMMADAFSTASFFLSTESAKDFISQEDLKAIFISSNLELVTVGECNFRE
ncbi:FAD:protein FMN transferase [Paenibacillus roseipurpureus]|uniref:FAD:protein FMN transferase n=1 Tax=Paenibacillus roseopurpureus TaxID=2918901 RepID=A0AA96RI86_9BACL|nr:FAD:protein FMN transferase [Paenibacillus sp. MBLB1832]WNR42500.1 FAD:protein FMN transferase [Paenibacillus sp. MBLB1832]